MSDLLPPDTPGPAWIGWLRSPGLRGDHLWHREGVSGGAAQG
jgi:hypothetical protein